MYNRRFSSTTASTSYILTSLHNNMRKPKKYSFKNSRSSINNYFKWRIERAKPAVEKINTIYKLTNKTTALDIGCGYGSLSSILSKKGVKVYGTEIDKEKLEIAKQKLKDKNLVLKLVEGEKLPFKKNFFNVVFLFDVIEHVNNPRLMLSEVRRVLKRGGLLYVEFTPYYSLVGHHLYDYTLLPIHFYKSKKSIKNLIQSKNPTSTFDSNYYLDLFLSLNKLKISTFQSLIENLNIINESYTFKFPELFETNLSFLKFIPSPFKDILTFSFEGIYSK